MLQKWRGWQIVLALAGIAVLVLLIAWPLRTLSTDDPYITYRYARNLATGRGLVYNVGERVLSTTAPFYAVILATGNAWLGIDIPAFSNALGALSFWAAASAIFLLGQCHGHPWAGFVAALVCASSPLLWLTLGFETGVYVALVCWAFWAFSVERRLFCALLLALATLVRNDAIVAAVLIGFAWWIEHRRTPWPWRYVVRCAALYAGMVGAWATWLTLQFGSPIPVTLMAKSIQARFGLTGFYSNTTFLEGLTILWRAWIGQTWIYWLALPALVLGTLALRRARWAWGLAGWSTLAIGAYVILGVAPYPWYYAPLAPLLALLLGIGVECFLTWSRAWGRAWGRAFFTIAMALPLLVAQFISVSQMAAAIHGPVPPPAEIEAKVLPEAKTSIYRRVGEWLASNTPAEATVGVTEVGVMGYYAERPMLDFLGLLQPEVAQALARGDILWSVPAYAPDYLALTAVNPLYTYPILKDRWFQQTYRPEMTFRDARFWGSPITVYRRVGDAPPLESYEVNLPVMDDVTLVSWAADRVILDPGTSLRTRLTWRTTDPDILDGAQVSVYLVDAAWHEIGQRAWLYETSAWSKDDEVDVYHPLLVAEHVPAGRYGLRVRIEDTGGAEVFEGEVGWLKSPPAVTVPPDATPLDVDAGFARLAGYTLSPEPPLQPGQPLTLTLYWAVQAPADRDWSIFVHLLDEAGERIAQGDGQPFNARYPSTAWGAGEIIPDKHALSLPNPLPDGPYQMLVGMYDLANGERLALFDADGHPLPDRAASLEISQ